MAIASVYQEPNGLTIKQRLFCDYYLSNGYNGTQAAKSAGYSQTEGVCCSIGVENLGKPLIKKYIGARMKEAVEKVGVGVEWRLEMLKKIMGACMDGSASKDGVVTPEAAIKSIAEMNKMDGSYAPTQTEAKVTVDSCEEMDDLIAKSKSEY